jgi:hypothetical protein
MLEADTAFRLFRIGERMRPVYETVADRLREGDVREYIMDKYECNYVQSGRLAIVDGYLHRTNGDLVAVVEIKCRNNAYNKYPTYMISANKWRNGLRLADDHGVIFLLVVGFTDGIYVTKMKENYEVKRGGRYDRGDSMDVEDCVYIPMSDFRRM